MRKKLFLLLPIVSLFTLTGCEKEQTVSKDTYDSMYLHIVNMWSESLEGIHYDIAFYGDSRIAGGDFQNRFDNAINLGIGGDKVINLISRFSLIEKVTPNYVFVSIGGNDAISNEFDESVFATQFETLLNKFEPIQTMVILNTNPGLSRSASNSLKDVKKINNKIAQTNSYIKGVCSARNWYLVDIASKLNDSDGFLLEKYTTDGVHYNDTAYNIWYNEIDFILEETKK